MRENILSFMLDNKPTKEVKGGFIIPGEVWRMSKAEELKEVSIFISSDLYLDVYSEYYRNKINLVESNFSCAMDEEYSMISGEDVYSIKGGMLAGIDVHGEYVVLGNITECGNNRG